jgi:pyruvate dehydrogenase phosphatase
MAIGAPCCAQRRLAHAHDLPGTRADPDAGGWPAPYTALDEPTLGAALAATAHATSAVLDAPCGLRSDTVNFQPCAQARSQDRAVTRTIDVRGRRWVLAAVFDGARRPARAPVADAATPGHLGEDTAAHAAYHLPIMVEEALLAAPGARAGRVDAAEVATLLETAIAAFDEAIARDVLRMLPGGLAGLARMPDGDISRIINDGGDNLRKTRLAMYGTTALIALVDPSREHLWLANLGDCQAGACMQNARTTRSDDKVQYCSQTTRRPGAPQMCSRLCTTARTGTRLRACGTSTRAKLTPCPTGASLA